MVDAFCEVLELKQAGHKLDLIQNRFEKKTAEVGQGAIGKISATVEIVPAFLIRRIKSGEVSAAAPGESSREGPQPKAVDPGSDEAGLRIQTGDTTVAIAKGMNPSQTMVRGGDGNRLVGGEDVRVGIGLEKARHHFWEGCLQGRLMTADLYFKVPKNAGDHLIFLSLLVEDVMQFRWKKPIELAMQPQNEIWGVHRETRFGEESMTHARLDLDVRTMKMLICPDGFVGGEIIS